MKKSLLVLLALAPLTLGLTGCVIAVGGEDGHSMSSSSDFEDREYENRKKIERIQLKSNFDKVSRNLGLADFTESFEQNGEAVKVVYYRTHRLHKDGLTTKDECTKLTFVNNLLSSIEQGK